MPVVDFIKDTATKWLPQKRQPGIPMPVSSASGGIGNGIASFEDEMPLSKPAIVFYACQIFFSFLAMCCFASVASFQAKWKIGVSGLSGLAIFVAVFGIFLSATMLLVPVIYDKYDKLVKIARAIREDRVHFILSSTGVILFLLISFTTMISAFTQAGCKDAKKDPHQDLGDQYQLELGGWCTTKKAGAVFFLFAFVSWAATFAVVLKEWREGKVRGGSRPRDPPFTAPIEHSHEDSETSSYYPVTGERESMRPLSHIQEEDDDEARSPFNDPPQTRYGAGPPPTLPPVNVGHGRQSMDTYGAFSDPVPSGYLDNAEPVSRTMQYADPYAVVRNSIGPRASPTSPTAANPPSYQSH